MQVSMVNLSILIYLFLIYSMNTERQLSKNLRTTWEKIYHKNGYNPNLAKREKHETYYSSLELLRFFDNLPNEALIVQGGCGHGSAIRLMSDFEAQRRIVPIGIDLSRRPLEIARKINSINALEGDVSLLPFAQNSVDGFFEVGVVEHFYREYRVGNPIVDRPLIVNSFKEIFRVLKPGMKAAFIQPSYKSFGRIEHNFRSKLGLWDMGFQEDFVLEDFIQLMEIAGFSNIYSQVIQAPRDLPPIIRYADNFAQHLLRFLGQRALASEVGMFFVTVGEKV